MKSRIYLDNAATTRMSKTVLEAMLPYFLEEYGNPSGIYGPGSRGKAAINRSRALLASSIDARPEEIFFTSGGTEADNWALKAVAELYLQRPDRKETQPIHFITTKIEHHAVLNTCAYLKQRGVEISYMEVDEYGTVDLDALEKAIRPETVLISVMAANNEIGTIEPIREIGAIAKKHGIWFHTDAVQAYGHIPISVQEWNIDLLSASAHKLNGPKGIGFLYVRRELRIPALHHGGAQERGRRAGTENVPAIVGFAQAAKEAMLSLKERMTCETELRTFLIEGIQREIPNAKLNGHPENRLPNNVHFSFPGVESETLLLRLDMEGVCGSGGSACTSATLDASHVLQAIGLSETMAKGSLRLTLSHETTKEELKNAIEILKTIVKEVRNQSIG